MVPKSLWVCGSVGLWIQVVFFTVLFFFFFDPQYETAICVIGILLRSNLTASCLFYVQCGLYLPLLTLCLDICLTSWLVIGKEVFNIC